MRFERSLCLVRNESVCMRGWVVDVPEDVLVWVIAQRPGHRFTSVHTLKTGVDRVVKAILLGMILDVSQCTTRFKCGQCNVLGQLSSRVLAEIVVEDLLECGETGLCCRLNLRREGNLL